MSNALGNGSVPSIEGREEILVFSPTFPRHSPLLIRSLLAIDDLSSTVADALDRIGGGSVLGSNGLKPLGRGMRLCGPAVTMEFQSRQEEENPRLEHQGSPMGYGELCAASSPGDIAVIDCGGNTSSAVLGGMIASRILLAGITGCVINGAVRDGFSIEKLNLPVWALERSPRSGLNRMRAVAINRTVYMEGHPISPGDYIVGDEDGMCIVPGEDFPRLVRLCLEAAAAEKELNSDTDRGH